MTALPYDVGSHAAALGVEPLDEIVAGLQATDEEYAQLWALHGPGNGWDTQRKALWSLLATEMRDDAATKGEKVTEAALEQRAHAHPKYQRFLTDGIVSRARFAHLESIRGVLTLRANRGQALARILANEPRT